MVGWHHWLNGHEFEQTLGRGEGQGGLVCCSIWDLKESDMAERLNNIWQINEAIKYLKMEQNSKLWDKVILFIVCIIFNEEKRKQKSSKTLFFYTTFKKWSKHIKKKKKKIKMASDPPKKQWVYPCQTSFPHRSNLNNLVFMVY